MCFFVAKDTAVNLQRKCGQNANKSIRGANAKNRPQNAKKTRWGRIANELAVSAVKTQRNALVKLCDAPEEVLSALPMDLSITIKIGSKEPK